MRSTKGSEGLVYWVSKNQLIQGKKFKIDLYFWISKFKLKNISTYSKRFLWENGIQTAQSPPWFTYWLRFDCEGKKDKTSMYVIDMCLFWVQIQLKFTFVAN